jgi:hypothetical protein
VATIAAQWQAEGGYRGVAEQIFRKMTVDIFRLEFDSPQCGFWRGRIDASRLKPERHCAA